MNLSKNMYIDDGIFEIPNRTDLYKPNMNLVRA